MKKLVRVIKYLFYFSIILLNINCAGFGPTSLLFSNTKTGVHGTVSSAPKKGIACNQSILGLVAFGNGGVKEAADKGGIQKIAAINLNAFHLLFLYSRLCTEVWGE